MIDCCSSKCLCGVDFAMASLLKKQKLGGWETEKKGILELMDEVGNRNRLLRPKRSCSGILTKSGWVASSNSNSSNKATFTFRNSSLSQIGPKFRLLGSFLLLIGK